MREREKKVEVEKKRKKKWQPSSSPPPTAAAECSIQIEPRLVLLPFPCFELRMRNEKYEFFPVKGRQNGN